MAGPFYVDDGGGKAVTAATKANPCQVTIVGHGFVNGNKVVFHNVGGMTQLNFTNGSAGYTVTKVDDDNITIGVDSSGYGNYTSGGTAHNGLSWGAAFLSLSALDDVFTFASGEIIYIGHDHVCQYTHTAFRTITGPTSGLPTYIISATQGSNPPTYQASTTNQVDTTEGAYAIVIDGCFAIYGVRFKAGANISISPDSDETVLLHDVTMAPAANEVVATAGAALGRTIAKNLTIDLTADGTTARSANVISAGGVTKISGLSFVNAGYRTGAIIGSSGTRWTEVSGADFSGFTNGTTPKVFQAQVSTGVMSNCLTAATWTPFYAWGGSDIRYMMTNVGPADAPTYLAYRTYYGDVVSSSAVYRSGGATVETVATSWLVTTDGTSTCSEGTPFYTPWIYGTVSSTGSKTFDLYITNDTADFTDAQVWLEIDYLNTADEAIWGRATDQRATIVTTAAAQTDDTTSTWNGAGPSYTYKQKLSVTATVNEEGQYRARVAVGVASIAGSRYFYVDPKVTVS